MASESLSASPIQDGYDGCEDVACNKITLEYLFECIAILHVIAFLHFFGTLQGHL